jgi:hypothetical protein
MVRDVDSKENHQKHQSKVEIEQMILHRGEETLPPFTLIDSQHFFSTAEEIRVNCETPTNINLPTTSSALKNVADYRVPLGSWVGSTDGYDDTGGFGGSHTTVWCR